MRMVATLKYFSSTSKQPKHDDGASDIKGIDNLLVSGLSTEGEVGNCEETEVEANQSLVAIASSDQVDVMSCTGADSYVHSHDKVAAIE